MPEKTIDDVRNFWNANPLMTGEFDLEAGSRAWFEEFDRVKRGIFLDDLSDWVSPCLVQGKRILDVGCGPGFWNRASAPFDCDYHGIDISDKSVELAQAAQAIFNVPGTISTCNAEDIQYDRDTFDHVISEGVIHHTPDTEKCAREIHRILKPGGTASISVYYKNIILKHNLLFQLCRKLSSGIGVGLKGRGRGVLMNVTNVDDFVRIYDGLDNPIGKSYVKEDFSRILSSFRHVRFTLYYFPVRAIPFNMPMPIARLLSLTFGFMILAKVQK